MIAAVVSCGGKSSVPDGGDSSGSAGALRVTRAPETVFLAGRVIDAETGVAVRAAVVRVAAANATTDADGSFGLETAAGRVTIEVGATGYLPVTRAIGTGSSPSFSLVVPIKRAGPTVSVPAQGGTVTSGAATLSFASGTYAATTPVTATWLDRRELGAQPGAPIFGDAAGQHRVLGALWVTAPQPAVAVRLSVTLPTPVPAASLASYTLGPSGAWTERTSPVAVAGNTVAFDIPHFSIVAIAQTDPTDALPVATIVSGSVIAFRSDGEPVALVAGDPVQKDVRFETGNGFAKLALPDGSELDLAAGTSVRELQIAVTAAGERMNGLVSLTYGKLRALVTRAISSSAELQISTPDTTMGVRGTVLSVEARDCEANNRHIVGLEVTEGRVDFAGGALMQSIVAGQQLDACVRCPDPKSVACAVCSDAEPSVVGETGSCEGSNCAQKTTCDDGHQFELVCEGGSCRCLRDGQIVSLFRQGFTCVRAQDNTAALRACGFPPSPEVDAADLACGPGEPCCRLAPTAPPYCDVAGQQCNENNVCAPCGIGPGAPCCRTYSCTGLGFDYDVDANLTCETQAAPSPGTCRRCGGVGEPCCRRRDVSDCDQIAAFTCTAPMTVCDKPSNACVDCGAIGQACCEGATCGAGVCRTVDVTPTCLACGAAGQPCCGQTGSQTCDTGSFCNGSGPAAGCEPCGASGQSCCPGNTCNSGITCDGTSCI